MNKVWKAIDYSDKYEKGIIKLFNEVFHKDRSIDFLKWENENNPAGKSIIKLAIDENEVAGHACLWLFKLKFFKDHVTACQGIDSMVHPDYRRQGVFEELMSKSFSQAEQMKIQVHYRFPNQAAFAAASKLGVFKVCSIPQYLKVLKGRKAASMFSSNAFVGLGLGLAFDTYKLLRGRINTRNTSYEIRNIDRFDESFDILWQQEKDSYNIAVQRDSAYLNWRYIDSPTSYKCLAVYKQNQLVGYIVGAIQNKQSKTAESIKLGHIADILCKEQDAAALKLMLQEMEQYMQKQGACALSCWMLKKWFYARRLEGAGYVNFRSPSILAAGVIGNKQEALAEQLMQQENWYITIGDSDYI